MRNCGPRILVVEDDLDIQSLLRYSLSKEGFAVLGCTGGRSVLPLCTNEKPDVVILDIMLPDTDGLEICRQIRHTQEIAETPVILLSARASESDRVIGLEYGANDYVTKPFSVRELIARVRVQVRGRAAATLCLGGLALDPMRFRASCAGRDLELTTTEFRLLEYMIQRPGVVFARGHLIQMLWPRDAAAQPRTIDVHFVRIRQKIESDPESGVYIRSVRGVGYALEPRSAAANPLLNDSQSVFQGVITP